MLKALRRTVKLFFAFMALIAITVMVFFWRVSNGPVLLDGNSQFLKNLLIQQDIGQNASFEQSILTWRGAENNPTGQSSFEIRFLNIIVENPETSLKINIPLAGIQLSTTALFRGLFAPTFIELSGLEINLSIPKEAWSGEEFDQDAFIIAMQAYIYEINTSSKLVPRLIRQLLSEAGPLKSTGYLQQFTLSDTAINVTDELSSDVWHIPSALLDIKRVENGLSLLLEGEIDIENEMGIPLHTSLQFDIEQKTLTSQIRFSNFVPNKIAGKVKGLSALATLNVPVSGIVDFSIDEKLEFPDLIFEVDIGQGTINPAELYNIPINIDEAGLSGQFVVAEQLLSIENFYVKTDGTELEANGFITNLTNNPDISIKAELQNMPLANLKNYWPANIVAGANARKWIENNVTGGMITDGTLTVEIRPEMWALEIIPDESFVFNFNIKNGSSHFLRPMPQVTNVIGSATLMPNNFLLNVTQGNVDDAILHDAVLNFNDTANKGKSVAQFELPITGTVEEILKLIDYQPLNYPSKFGIVENSVLGKAEAHLTLEFPLIKDLKLVDIIFTVQADIEELNIPKLSETLALTQGTMMLSVDGDGIEANGDVLLNGIDFNAQWTEDFTGTEIHSTRYIIEGELENEEWENLFLPFEPYVKGPAKAELTLYGKGANIVRGSGSFDLIDSEITFDPIGWHKESGEQADAIYNLEFLQGGIINVNDIAFGSEKLNSNLQLQYNGERTSRLYFKDLSMSDADFSALFDWEEKSALYQVSLNGERFNAVPLMDIILSPAVEGEEVDLPDFKFAGKIANMTMYNNVIMHDTSILAGYTDNEVIDFGYSAKWLEDKNLSIIIAQNDEQDDTQKKLTLQTNDAGQALRGLDFFTSGDQGILFIDANMTKKEKGYSLEGTIKAEKFTVADSTLFNELLEAKEFTKAQEELEKNGLSFETFESDFIQYDEVMTISSGSAKGPTLGVTLDGFVDQKFDQIALRGTIIPVYGLNSLLSNIPILGTILAGGKGEGVFAATYDMTGSIEDPNVNINPLMALAPGIFRKIFGVFGGDVTKKPTLRDEAENIQVEAETAQVEVPSLEPAATPITPPN